MKKQILLIGTFLSISIGFSQNTFTNSGTNVGIGTLSPNEKLEVIGGIKGVQGIFSNEQSNGQTYSSWGDRNLNCQLISAGAIIDFPSKARTFNFWDFPTSNYNPYPEVFLGISDRSGNDRFQFSAEMGSSSLFKINDKNQASNFQIIDDGNNKVEVLLPKSNSFLGIGTSNFIDGIDIYKLAVKGAIRAERVRVYTTWADFVFDKNYNLPTLEEVEKHIQINGHLKDIPSAKDVELNGIELGEMNKLLLQKVEELTLYMIEMKKEISVLRSQIKNNKL